MAYSRILRRLREKKTNYNKRSRMLMGRRDFVTVQITNENTHVQVHKPEMAGDRVVASADPHPRGPPPRGRIRLPFAPLRPGASPAPAGAGLASVLPGPRRGITMHVQSPHPERRHRAPRSGSPRR